MERWPAPLSRQFVARLDTALLKVSPTTMPWTPPEGLRNAVIRPNRIPCTTSTGTSARTNSLAICHNISLSRTLLRTTFKCSVVIPEGPPRCPVRPCRTHFKNPSRENCVSGLCRIRFSGSGALNSGGLLGRVCQSSSCLCRHLERKWLPPMLALLRRALPTQPMPVRVQPPSQRCQLVCDADATHLLCELRRRLALPQKGDPLAIRKQRITFTEFFGINPPLPDLKRRILDNNKSFHARTLDISALRQSFLHLDKHLCGKLEGFFMTSALSRKTSSRSSNASNALAMARFLLTTGTTSSPSMESICRRIPSG